MLGDGARTVEMRVDIRWYIPSRRSKIPCSLAHWPRGCLSPRTRSSFTHLTGNYPLLLPKRQEAAYIKAASPDLIIQNFTLPFSHLLFVFSLFQSLNGVLSICTLFRPGVLSFFFYATLSSIHSLSRPSRLRLIYSSTLHILSKKFD